MYGNPRVIEDRLVMPSLLLRISKIELWVLCVEAREVVPPEHGHKTWEEHKRMMLYIVPFEHILLVLESEVHQLH